MYRLGGRIITQRSEIERLDSLKIPPAWTDVKIARSRSVKVLARGVDAAGRIQAIYHPAFRRRQEQEKFDRMLRFGRALPRLRAQVEHDLGRRRLSRDRVTACVIKLIDLKLFRVGNAQYAKRYRSYGATTLRQEHLTVTTSGVEFDFVGKSGKRQHERLRDPRMAHLVKRLLELPGAEVFRFFDEDGVVQDIRSRHVNAYIQRYMGEEFTAKDFRTWGATVLVAAFLIELDPAETKDSVARAAAVRKAVAAAAERLGNTAVITRSSYIDPRVLTAAESPDRLQQTRQSTLRRRRYLTDDEQRAIRLLVAGR